jgi:hypothetical protein
MRKGVFMAGIDRSCSDNLALCGAGGISDILADPVVSHLQASNPISNLLLINDGTMAWIGSTAIIRVLL